MIKIGSPMNSNRKLYFLFIWFTHVLYFSSILHQVQAGNYNYNDNNDDDVNDSDNNIDDDDDDGYVDPYYNQEQQQQQQQQQGNNNEYSYNDGEDDTFYWMNTAGEKNAGFDGVSIMPIACMNYNHGHMVKYQLFDTEKAYSCHFGEISTFVVSLSHYIHAWFNVQALLYGQSFELPVDAAFVNCNRFYLPNTASNSNNNNNAKRYLYGKIGCTPDRATWSSTRLQLHLYLDAQCSQPLQDGRTARQHAWSGYHIATGNNNNNNGGDGDSTVLEISTHVSFSLPFYHCQDCNIGKIHDNNTTWNPRINNNWYDDDYIRQNGQARGDYQYNYNNKQNDDQDEQEKDDDGNNNRRRHLLLQHKRIIATVKPLAQNAKQFEMQFWKQVQNERRRFLGGGNKNNKNKNDDEDDDDDDGFDVTQWNFCQRLYKYGFWCDDDCRALDIYRTDAWSFADITLLLLLGSVQSGMMLLIVTKRMKAQQKARLLYGDDQPLPGLPPFGMALLFAVFVAVVGVLAKLSFVNETLVFATVTCILLFIYMLKLTLFENRRPVILAAPRHDMFDNPLNDHLFD